MTKFLTIMYFIIMLSSLEASTSSNRNFFGTQINKPQSDHVTPDDDEKIVDEEQPERHSAAWNMGMFQQLPSIRWRIDPTTNLKLRKYVHAFGTRLSVGGDFNSQSSEWKFRASWEDQLIHGKFAFVGRELQFMKTWLLPIPDNDTLNAKLRFKLGLDMVTGRSYCRFGFRTNELLPTTEELRGGFPVEKLMMLDPASHVGIEFRGRVAFPSPVIEYNSEVKHLDMGGGGNITMTLDELNVRVHL